MTLSKKKPKEAIAIRPHNEYILPKYKVLIKKIKKKPAFPEN